VRDRVPDRVREAASRTAVPVSGVNGGSRPSS
jgi:hypothetical protein